MPRAVKAQDKPKTGEDLKPQKGNLSSCGTDFSVVSCMTKDERIRTEYDRLFALFVGVDPNKIEFVKAQVHELAFLNVSIIDLQTDISRTGTMIQYSNGGGQEGYRQNPDLKTLVDFQKLTNSIVRVLLPLVPDKESFRNDFDCD